MASEYWQGALGGAGTGASAGFAIGGPVGAGVGAGVGALAGLAQGAEQRKRRMAADRADAAINPIDPELVAFRERLGRQEQAYRAGSDTASGFAKQGQMDALAQTQANLPRIGVSNVGQFLRTQAQAGKGIAQIGADAAGRADALLPMQGNISTMLSERVYQLQQQRAAQALSRAEQGQQDLYNMFYGAIGAAPQIGMAFQKGQPRPGQIFDPLAARSPGMGTYYPGAYDSEAFLPPQRMQPRYPWSNTP